MILDCAGQSLLNLCLVQKNMNGIEIKGLVPVHRINKMEMTWMCLQLEDRNLCNGRERNLKK